MTDDLKKLVLADQLAAAVTEAQRLLAIVIAATPADERCDRIAVSMAHSELLGPHRAYLDATKHTTEHRSTPMATRTLETFQCPDCHHVWTCNPTVSGQDACPRCDRMAATHAVGHRDVPGVSAADPTTRTMPDPTIRLQVPLIVSTPPTPAAAAPPASALFAVETRCCLSCRGYYNWPRAQRRETYPVCPHCGTSGSERVPDACAAPDPATPTDPATRATVPITDPGHGRVTSLPNPLPLPYNAFQGAGRVFPGSMPYADLAQACRNVGVDLDCAACAELFFSGSTAFDHHTCAAPHVSGVSAKALTLDEQRDLMTACNNMIEEKQRQQRIIETLTRERDVAVRGVVPPVTVAKLAQCEQELREEKVTTYNLRRDKEHLQTVIREDGATRTTAARELQTAIDANKILQAALEMVTKERDAARRAVEGAHETNRQLADRQRAERVTDDGARRDTFATAALQALLTTTSGPEPYDDDVLATRAYALAGAMLRARRPFDDLVLPQESPTTQEHPAQGHRYVSGTLNGCAQCGRSAVEHPRLR